MKIGTKPCARSRRNELVEATERWTGLWKKRPDAGPEARQTGVISSDRTLDRTLEATDQTQGSSVRSITETFQSSETMTGRWQHPIEYSRLQRSGRPDASGQHDFSVRSVAEKRDFILNDYLLSRAYK